MGQGRWHQPSPPGSLEGLPNPHTQTSFLVPLPKEQILHPPRTLVDPEASLLSHPKSGLLENPINLIFKIQQHSACLYLTRRLTVFPNSQRDPVKIKSGPVPPLLHTFYGSHLTRETGTPQSISIPPNSRSPSQLFPHPTPFPCFQLLRGGRWKDPVSPLHESSGAPASQRPRKVRANSLGGEGITILLSLFRRIIMMQPAVQLQPRRGAFISEGLSWVGGDCSQIGRHRLLPGLLPHSCSEAGSQAP